MHFSLPLLFVPFAPGLSLWKNVETVKLYQSLIQLSFGAIVRLLKFFGCSLLPLTSVCISCGLVTMSFFVFCSSRPQGPAADENPGTKSTPSITARSVASQPVGPVSSFSTGQQRGSQSLPTSPANAATTRRISPPPPVSIPPPSGPLAIRVPGAATTAANSGANRPQSWPPPTKDNVIVSDLESFYETTGPAAPSRPTQAAARTIGPGSTSTSNGPPPPRSAPLRAGGMPPASPTRIINQGPPSPVFSSGARGPPDWLARAHERAQQQAQMAASSEEQQRANQAIQASAAFVRICCFLALSFSCYLYLSLLLFLSLCLPPLSVSLFLPFFLFFFIFLFFSFFLSLASFSAFSRLLALYVRPTLSLCVLKLLLTNSPRVADEQQ